MKYFAQERSTSGANYDVIVIGGGISGVAIARACAQGRLRTLLLEKSDFGAGTSSRSTRIIHGGLRYLEHGELGLVRESLKERERLRVERPHLVRPARFLLAFPQDAGWSVTRNPIALRTGLWLYSRMGGVKEAGISTSARKKLTESMEGWRIFDYEDAQCEFPERLIAEWLVEAVAAGAVARNHTDVLEVSRSHKKVTGVISRDVATGVETFYSAEKVVNATGPWADQICATSEMDCAQMIGGVRGSHIVLPKFAGAPSNAVYTEALDGRPFFVIPWNQQLLVGTTEVPDQADPTNAQASPEEIDYLFRSFARVFHASGLQPDDVLFAFAGVRPLPVSGEKKMAAITRKYLLHDHKHDGAAGMISVIGGKLTTAAGLGRHCARMLGAHVPEPEDVIVARGPSNGYDATLAQWSRQVAESTRNCRGQVSPQSARAIAEWHGRGGLNIVRRAAQSPLLAETLCAHTHHVVAEAVHAVDVEQAVTLGDILLRRVPVALSGCWQQECMEHASERIGKALGWNISRLGYQVEAFEHERAAFLQQPPRSNGGRGRAPIRKNIA
ncbi:MAG TPA: glycerol-3-phosphate dehydrogenase/oxidase [Terriglobales bacterium]|nr:glycerol-3-phosphate dehydrogenase/oxidase [Terriglobales bacterium]